MRPTPDRAADPKNDAVRLAIEAADAASLRELIRADPARADADVHWGEGGKNVVPPLHYVCDAVFRGQATQAQALELANVLLEAGVDPERAYAKSGDTFLISAASLGAQSVALRLVELGVDVGKRGLFGATALHWAANLGLDRLALALLERGADLELGDAHYGGSPLQWALHGWTDRADGDREGLLRVVRLLVERGAQVSTDPTTVRARESDERMRDALAAKR